MARGTWRRGDRGPGSLLPPPWRRDCEHTSTPGAGHFLRPHSLGIRGGPPLLSKAPSPWVSPTPASRQGSSTPWGRRRTTPPRRETALYCALWSPSAHNAPGPAGRPLRPLIFPRIQFKEAAGPAVGSAHGPTKPRLREKRLRVTDGAICGPTGWAAGRRALPSANQSAGRGSGRSGARVG